jgi:hypothetical protein
VGFDFGGREERWVGRNMLVHKEVAVAMPAEEVFLYKVGKRVPKYVTRVRIHHSVEQILKEAFPLGRMS